MGLTRGCKEHGRLGRGRDRGLATPAHLVVRRRLNATSAMVVAPSFHRTEASALDALNGAAPRVAIGLHLTLTAPFRPLSKRFRPLREGAFPPLAAMAGR